MTNQNFSIVYMVAGLSSRFGGKIKQFAQVGLNGESIIEVSMNQAIRAGFNSIVLIVGEKTEQPFKEKFGESYHGVPIRYALQRFNSEERDRPWGTVDALVCAQSLLDENFAVCNGDDLYGENSFAIVIKKLKTLKENECVTVGYPLLKVLPSEGTVNRGIFKVENGFVVGVNEVLGLSLQNFKEKSLNENSLCNMNLFGMNPPTLELLNQTLLGFKKNHAGDRKIECFLPVELGNLVANRKIKMPLEKTTDRWFGVTNPDDEEKVRKELAEELKN